MATGPFGFRVLLEDAVKILRANFVPLALPLIVLAVITGSGQGEPSFRFDAADLQGDAIALLPFFAFLGLVAIAVAVVLFFAYVLAWVMASRAALDAVDGRAPPPLGQQLRDVWPQLLPASGTFLLGLLLVILGLVALVVPGFIVLAGLFPLAAVVAAEKSAGMAAIKRAWALSRGHRGVLLGLLVVATLAIAIGSALVSWVPLIGRALGGIVGGTGSAFLAVLGALYYRRVTPGPA